MKFRHVNSGDVMEVNESHSVYEILKDSPSWIELNDDIVNEPKPKSKTTSKTKND